MAKKQLEPEEKERRRVHRIQQFGSLEFRGIVVSGDQRTEARVIDFHFEGARLGLDRDVTDDFKVDQLELYYGNQLISKIQNPQIVHVGPKVIALNFKNSVSHGGLRGPLRHKVKADFRPIVLATDPIRLKSSLHFHVNNFNAKGMQFETSLSNKHLLKDMKLANAMILLPGLTTVHADVVIRYTNYLNGRLVLGVEFERISSEDLESLARFAIFGTETAETEISEKVARIHENFGSFKRLGNALKIENLTYPRDFEDVLRIRHLAYKAVGIIEPSAQPENMTDEFDKRSILIVGKIDGAVIGTVRLVRCLTESDQFMFEGTIPFSDLSGVTSRQDFFEISRLAIDPDFQNSDLILRLFEEIARQVIINHKDALCLARNSQQKSYRRAGFRPISKSVNHPLIAGESLTVMSIEKRKFLKGSHMPALSWMAIAKDVGDNLAFAKIVRRPKSTILKPIRAKLESWLLKVLKTVEKRKKQLR